MHLDTMPPSQWSEALCSTVAAFACETEPTQAPADVDSHLHGNLFLQGRCAAGYYEYRSACYSIVSIPADTQRSEKLEADVATKVCRETVPEAKRDCANHLGTAKCPIPMSPHNAAEGAYQRSLIDRFAFPAEAAWVGLKADWEHVYVSGPTYLTQ